MADRPNLTGLPPSHHHRIEQTSEKKPPERAQSLKSDEDEPATDEAARVRVEAWMGTNLENDVRHTMRTIARLFERQGYPAPPWLVYWRAVRRRITSPRIARGGIYNVVARDVIAEAQERCDGMRVGSRYTVAETKRCAACNGVGGVAGEYCSCQLGRELARQAEKKARAS